MEQNHKTEIIRISERFSDNDASNYVPADSALRPDLAGMRMFGHPILAVADASDPLFEELRAPEAIGEHFLTPRQWLPDARSVISFFLPFMENVNQANRAEPCITPPEWLHSRIEGQLMLNSLLCHLRDYCTSFGYASIIPTLDERFWSNGKPFTTHKENGTCLPGFTSNWSERHVAYVCGLGTFGLSRHLITAKGTAGRFGSVVTAMPLEPNPRPYRRYDEYCIHCGLCITQCPVDAITEAGKNQTICGAYIDQTMITYKPRYGCGKCSVGVPCQSCNPACTSTTIEETV